jgi:hypothetical protein
MTLTAFNSSTIHEISPSSAGEAASKITSMQTKIKDKRNVCLVSFGYCLKESTAERRTALEAAVKSHGTPAVLNRLEFLQEAWCGTQKFVESIDQDMGFVKSVGETSEFPFPGGM